LNYITGGTLKVLEDMLNDAVNNKYVPYKNVLGNYVTEDEALARYQALKSWYESKGHFWVGDGPFYLESVDPTAHIFVIKANRNYPDKADKWAVFGKPKMPEITVEGPTTVISGLGSKFNVKVTFEGAPYKLTDVESVKYIVVDASGKVAAVGTAEPVEDGLWTVGLEAADTSALTAGSTKLLVAVSSKLVSIPGLKETSFTVLSLEDYVNGKLSGIQAQIETRISSLESSIQSLEEQVSSLQSSLSTMNTMAMASMGVAVIAIIIAIVAVTKKK